MQRFAFLVNPSFFPSEPANCCRFCGEANYSKARAGLASAFVRLFHHSDKVDTLYAGSAWIFAGVNGSSGHCFAEYTGIWSA